MTSDWLRGFVLDNSNGDTISKAFENLSHEIKYYKLECDKPKYHKPKYNKLEYHNLMLNELKKIELNNSLNQCKNTEGVNNIITKDAKDDIIIELKNEINILKEELNKKDMLNKRLIDTLMLYRYKEFNNTTTYDYNKIKQKNKALNAEFKRVAKLKKLC